MNNNTVEWLTLEMIKRFGTNAAHIARELDDIADAVPDISRIAVEMIKRFGGGALHIAREMANIAKGVPEMQYSEVWCDIANAIERRYPSKDRHANDNNQPPSNSRPRHH